jgi:hypothetical protein
MSSDGLKPSGEPSNISAFDFKGKSARFGFCAVSTTIVNDWSISDLSDGRLATDRALENTVSSYHNQSDSQRQTTS